MDFKPVQRHEKERCRFRFSEYISLKSGGAGILALGIGSFWESFMSIKGLGLCIIANDGLRELDSGIGALMVIIQLQMQNIRKASGMRIKHRNVFN